MPAQIVEVMSQFRRDVQAGEDVATRALANGWLSVERRLQDSVELTARVLLDEQRAGRTATPNMILRHERFQMLLEQARAEVDRYATNAERIIAGRQRDLVGLGIQHASEAIQTVSANAQFNRLPVAAVQNLIGLSGDGSPLKTLLQDSYGAGADGILEEMVRGVATGKGPVSIARAVVRQGLSRSLDRMILISRTETLRVYRTASLQTFVNSGIVKNWIWKCALSLRTCVGCLAMDGSVHPMSEPFGSHPACRCTMLPWVTGVDKPQFETGEQWLASQPEATQRKILGKGSFDAYKAGVPFGHFATIKQDATWGASVQPTPVSTLKRLVVTKAA